MELEATESASGRLIGLIYVGNDRLVNRFEQKGDSVTTTTDTNTGTGQTTREQVETSENLNKRTAVSATGRLQYRLDNGMRVLLFEQDHQGRFHASRHWSNHALATTTTHDLPTIAGVWMGEERQARIRVSCTRSSASSSWNPMPLAAR